MNETMTEITLTISEEDMKEIEYINSAVKNISKIMDMLNSLDVGSSNHGTEYSNQLYGANQFMTDALNHMNDRFTDRCHQITRDQITQTLAL